MRRIYARDLIIASDALDVVRHVSPGRAAVLAQLHGAVIRADPEHAWQDWRFSDGGDVAVIGRAVVLRRHRLVAVDAHNRQLAAVDLLAQVNARRPGVAAVERFEELVRPDVYDTRVVRRERNRRVPVEAVLLADGRRGNDVALQRVAAAEAEPARSLDHLLYLFLCGLLPFARLSAGARRRPGLRLLSGALPASTSRPRPSRALGRARADRDAAASLQIETLNIAVLRFGVDRRVISRVDLRIKTVASADAVPVGVDDSAAATATATAAATTTAAAAATAAASASLARAAPTAVILQASANVVRLSHVHSDSVELRRRDVVNELPSRGLVVADIQTAVVADNQVVRVIRIDPQRVVIAVRDALNHLERFAAVGGFVEGGAAGVDDLVVLGVDTNLAVVHRAIVVVAHDAPGLAFIVRAPDAAALRVGRLVGLRLLASASETPASAASAASKTTASGLLFTASRAAAGAYFDLRVDDVRVRARDVDADASKQAFRQAIAFELRPRLAGVGRLPDGAARSTAVDAPGRAAALVGGGVKNLRVGRVDHDVGESSVLVNGLDIGPSLAAVGGLVNSALFVLAEETAERSDVDGVGVLRVNNDARDGLRLFQSDVGEGLAPVG